MDNQTYYLCALTNDNRPANAKKQIGQIIRYVPAITAIFRRLCLIFNRTQDICRDRQRLAERYNNVPVTRIPAFPGLTTKLSYLCLQKWTYRHNSALLWGSINSLEAQATPERAMTHVFYVTLELTDEARAGTRLKVKRMFKVVDAVAIEKKQLEEMWWQVGTQLQVRPEKEEDVITTAVVRCGEYCDFLDALHRKKDLREGLKNDKAWKGKFLEATKPSNKEFDVVKSDPLQYELD